MRRSGGLKTRRSVARDLRNEDASGEAANAVFRQACSGHGKARCGFETRSAYSGRVLWPRKAWRRPVRGHRPEKTADGTPTLEPRRVPAWSARSRQNALRRGSRDIPRFGILERETRSGRRYRRSRGRTNSSKTPSPGRTSAQSPTSNTARAAVGYASMVAPPPARAAASSWMPGLCAMMMALP